MPSVSVPMPVSMRSRRVSGSTGVHRAASEWRSPCSSRTTARSAVSSSGEDKVSDATRWNASISSSRADGVGVERGIAHRHHRRRGQRPRQRHIARRELPPGARQTREDADRPVVEHDRHGEERDHPLGREPRAVDQPRVRRHVGDADGLLLGDDPAGDGIVQRQPPLQAGGAADDARLRAQLQGLAARRREARCGRCRRRCAPVAISASRSSTSPGSRVEVRSRLDSASTSSSRALWSNSSLIAQPGSKGESLPIGGFAVTIAQPRPFDGCQFHRLASAGAWTYHALTFTRELGRTG